MSKGANTIFTFRLTAAQAQQLFNIHECMWEETELISQIWTTKKSRSFFRKATRSFQQQLDRQYQETGVQV